MMGTAETATAPNQKGELVDHNKKYELTQHLVPFTNLLHIVKLLLHFFLPDLMKTFFFFFSPDNSNARKEFWETEFQFSLINTVQSHSNPESTKVK